MGQSRRHSPHQRRTGLYVAFAESRKFCESTANYWVSRAKRLIIGHRDIARNRDTTISLGVYVCRAQVGEALITPKRVIGRALQRSTLMKDLGYPTQPDRMYPIGSYVLRGAGCHDNGDHVLCGAPRHIWM
eukprot:6213586-Pleurochrysis_carterae.AAC.4